MQEIKSDTRRVTVKIKIAKMLIKFDYMLHINALVRTKSAVFLVSI